MGDVWVVVDGHGQVGAALEAAGVDGGAVTALVVGHGDLADQVSPVVGAVQWIETGDAPAEAFADAVATLVEAADPALVVGPTTPAGRALTGAVAVRRNVPLISTAVGIRRNGDGVVEADRVQLEGRVVETVRAATPVCVLVDPSDAQPATRDVPAPVTPVPATPFAVRRVAVESVSGDAARIAAAERIVAVGRGLGSQDALDRVEQLAQVLDAEIGCSMPVADDLGWVPRERYVGVSGQHVAPRLYLALGISGAPQHLAGIRGAKTVVAVDSDPNAPILRRADYAIVGDVHEVVPALAQALAE